MRRYMEVANRTAAKTGEGLLDLLERRLDRVVRHVGLATSPRFARQLVSHGHIRVNGVRVDRPSFMVKTGDVVELESKARENFYVQLALKNFEQRGSQVPAWISWDKASVQAKILRSPTVAEFTLPVNHQYIVEFYTRR